MKKTFLAKRNSLISSTKFSWGTYAILFAVFVFFVRLAAPNLFLHTFAPIFRLSDAISTQSGALFGSLSDSAVLADKNKQLINENAALEIENLMLEQKVANLIGIIGNSDIQRTAIPGILAGVLAHPPESPYDTLVLAAGARDGAAIGMKVFANGGVPIGIISSVTNDFSRATLFSAPGNITRGWVGMEGVPVDIKGAGAGVMNASLSRSAGIVVGDTVFAPGPGMLPIGSVIRIDSSPSSPEVTLRIAPATNIFSLAWVELRGI